MSLPDLDMHESAPSSTSDMPAEAPQWYALRFLYRDQPRMRAQLAAAGFELFTPTKPVVRVRNGRRIREQLPVLWNLLFVRTTREALDPYVASCDYFQYIYKKGGRYCEPLVVPDDQMTRFVRAVTATEHPLYFTPEELNLSKGTRVRLHGGPLDGYEGVLLKVAGSRSRRLIVELPETLIAAVEVCPDLIEVVK